MDDAQHALFESWRAVLEGEWETEMGTPRYAIARMMFAPHSVAKDVIDDKESESFK